MSKRMWLYPTIASASARTSEMRSATWAMPGASLTMSGLMPLTDWASGHQEVSWGRIREWNLTSPVPSMTATDSMPSTSGSRPVVSMSTHRTRPGSRSRMRTTSSHDILDAI